MSIHNDISKELNPLFDALMQNPETRKSMVSVTVELPNDVQLAVSKDGKYVKISTKSVTSYVVECRYSGETPSFDTLAEAVNYVATKRITGKIYTAYDTFEVINGWGVKKRFSKKRLLAILKDIGYIDNDGKVSFEAYGKDVQAYIMVRDLTARSSLEALLRLLGQKVNDSYYIGHPVVNVGVTYFKAWHWDE